MNNCLKLSLFIVTGLLIFAVGLMMIAPEIYWGESAIITARAWQMGGSHPPGYSGYLQLIHMFQRWIPLGSIAFRSNVAGLIFLSVFGLLLLNVLLKLNLPNYLSVPVTLGFCFSIPVMDASMAVEVYSLHLLIFALILSLAQSGIPVNKRIYLLAFVTTLMVTHHLTSALMLPALILWILMTHKKHLKLSFLLPIFLLVIMGFSVYLYLPLRDSVVSGSVWGNPGKLEGFVRLVTASEEASGAILSGLTDMKPVLSRGRLLLNLLNSMLTLPGLLMVLAGVYSLQKRFRGFSLFCLVSFAMLAVPVVIYDSHESSSFFLPGFMIVWIWFAFGLDEFGYVLVDKLHVKNSQKLVFLLVVASSILTYNTLQSYENRASDVYIPGLLVRRSLDTADDNGVIISRRSDWCFLHWYVVQVEKRKNVKAVFQPLLSFPWYYHELMSQGLAPLTIAEELFEDSRSWNSAVTASLAVQNIDRRFLRFAEKETVRDVTSAGFHGHNLHCSLFGTESRQSRNSLTSEITFPGRLDPTTTRTLGYLYYQYAECLLSAGQNHRAADALNRGEHYRQHGLHKGWWD
jgi:hypothetical protein